MELPIIYHPDYIAPLPPGHRFPMSKFRQLYELLLADGVAQTTQFHTPKLPPLELIELVHTPEYVKAYCEGTLEPKAQRRIGLPWSPELVNRTCVAVGGTHHAFPSYGSGFCIFNDLAIACRVLQKLGLVEKVLIVDLDVHQGDGTAFIFQGDESVFTFSMHCEVNFPGTKQTSDLDVPLAVGMEDDAYLQTLANYLPDLLSHIQPDLILYDAGVDPHIGDRLGKLALSDTGLFRREMQVLSTCVAAGYPVACVIGGGYADDIKSLVWRHSLLHRAASQVYHQYGL
ncbi:histone deacetylase [Nodularia chucula]|uniref:histone deacetylase family protein n=1 Tax=Nodularia chucula TaxID=3093667 RepID=UPI0039C60B4B